jgi:hypothetical protein
MNANQPKRKVVILLCAGQQCSMRWKCRRFLVRGYGHAYASYDIERRLLKGDCPSFEPRQGE